jgi:Uma2 family endonuclease
MAAEHDYVPDMATPLLTAEDLPKSSIPNKRTELVRGRLIVREPAGWRHGAVTMNLALRLGQHIDLTGAGQLLAAETGFTLSRGPDTVRAPDIAFVRRDRIPTNPAAFPDLAPDLVVEVLSPDDRPGETLAKVGEWLEAGAQRVWVIDPERRIARVYRQDGTETIIEPADSLQGEDVLPGFSCPLAAILK